MTASLEILSAHFDRELTVQDCTVMSGHIETCVDCRAALDAWRVAATVLRDTSAAAPAPIPHRAITAALVLLVLIAGSGAAMATGLFSEIFRSGNVFAVDSRPVTLDEARVTGLPLPSSDAIRGGWRLDRVYLTYTPDLRSVDLQYGRPGSVGIGIRVTSDPLRTSSAQAETFAVAGVDVVVTSQRDSTTEEDASVRARFEQHGGTVEIRGSARELDRSQIISIVTDWIRQARK